MAEQDFTEEQKQYLQGFAAGSGVVQAALPTWTATLGTTPAAQPSNDPHGAAQGRFVAAGKKLSAEEQAKAAHNGLDLWDQVVAHAQDARFPKGTDVFLFKFQGLFYVAPAQDAFMCRLRFAAGMVRSHQLRGVADLAKRYGGGYADVTTRANLQIRQIGPKDTIDLLMGLHELGIINRGAGADNVRNITASPTAGFDPDELFDTRPLASQMHHFILNHRDLYGLPRKFNIAFDGGGTISALEDTNDIGFAAVRVGAGADGIEPGIYFRMQLGGITGHRDFARDCGVLLRPQECVPVAAAILRVFIDHADRTDRKRARLKYLLDEWGLDRYLAEAEKWLPRALLRVPLDRCEPRRTAVDRLAHIGFYPQKQPGRSYVGLVLSVGRISAAQMRGLAAIADGFGSGDLRLTVWQNLLIPDLSDDQIPAVKAQIEALGLHWRASEVRAGLVACTGSAGCKYAAADTKAHALQIADHLEPRVKLDQPVNIHLTGCHHSCAQHYIGDVGLLATKISVGEEMIEGYHVYAGGGYGDRQEIGHEIYRDVPANETGPLIERMLGAYLRQRRDPRESFQEFVKRHSTEQLKGLFESTTVNP